jgi:hypothetical protein
MSIRQSRICFTKFKDKLVVLTWLHSTRSLVDCFTVMSSSSPSIPDHIRCGGSIYYVTWPGLIICVLFVMISSIALSEAQDLIVEQFSLAPSSPTTKSNSAVALQEVVSLDDRKKESSSSLKSSVNNPKQLRYGIIKRFCEHFRDNERTSHSYQLRYLGYPEQVDRSNPLPSTLAEDVYPLFSQEKEYCTWLSNTTTLVSFKVCTFDPQVDTQISYYVHKDGHWDGSKKEMMESMLPILPRGKIATEYLSTNSKSVPKITEQTRTLFIDVGSNIGFFSLLAAARGYDVISVEASSEAVIRQLFSLVENGIRVARSGEEFETCASGYGSSSGASTSTKGKKASLSKDQILSSTPLAYVYNNAAYDAFRQLHFTLIKDNVGASFVTEVENGGESQYVEGIALDDLLNSNARDQSRSHPGMSSGPVIDPMKVQAIKISLEGMDSRALHGMRRLISKGNVPFVNLIYNQDHVKSRSCDPNSMIYSLFENGYRLYYAGVFIYRQQELERFLKGMSQRSVPLYFVKEGTNYY